MMKFIKKKKFLIFMEILLDQTDQLKKNIFLMNKKLFGAYNPLKKEN